MKSILILGLILEIFLVFVPSITLASNPSNSEELKQALEYAQPGETITLLPIDYKGDFQISKNGEDNAPITITGYKTDKGVSTTIIATETGFNVRGDYWVIQNLSIKNGKTGIRLDGDKNKISKVSFNNVGKGVIISGTENKVKDSIFQSKEMGILLERGQKNDIKECTFPATSPSLKMDSDVCCGNIEKCTFSGPVTIGGNDNKIESSTFSNGLTVQGCKNKMTKCNIKRADFTKSCDNPHDKTNTISDSTKIHSIFLMFTIPAITILLF